MNHYSRALSVGLLGILAAACSSGDDADIKQSDALIAGGVAAPEYAEAVRLSNSSGAFCSGALIAPRVVLTAGHCVRLPGAWTVTAPYAGGQRASVINSGTVYPGNNADGTDNLNASDVGLMALDNPIYVATYATPSLIALPQGSGVVNVGTSQNGQSQTDPLRGGVVAVTTAAEYTYYWGNDIIQPGDSGGPTYVPNTHIVVAVNAAAGSGQQALSRVDLVAPWIYQQMQAWGLPYNAPAVETAFQANTTSLWAAGNITTADLGAGMMPGTSPSITPLAGGGYQIAFQANTGSLWTTGSAGTQNWGLGMAGGTSPSITALPDGGFEVAFQANTGSLWTAGTNGVQDHGLGMMAGSSPSITYVPMFGITFAFQANNHDLWVVGAAGPNGPVGGQVAGHTSPSIAGLWQRNAEYVVAFQAPDGSLGTYDNWVGTQSLGLGMMANTSPSVTALQPGGYEIAFQANSSALWVTGSAGTSNLQFGMMPGTSPAITKVVTGGYEVSFMANTGSLWMVGNTINADMHLGMAAQTSPAGH